MEKDLIGAETWACGRYALTPWMRREILMAVAEMYVAWSRRGYSWSCDDELRYEKVEPFPVETPDDFLHELTDEFHPVRRAVRLEYFVGFFTWLRGYCVEQWGGDIGEPDEHSQHSPLWLATIRAWDWMTELRVCEVTEWHAGQLVRNEAGGAQPAASRNSSAVASRTTRSGPASGRKQSKT
jgi:hypothetical protein